MDLRKEKNSHLRKRADNDTLGKDFSRNQSPYGVVRTTRPQAGHNEGSVSRSGEGSHFTYRNTGTQRLSSPQNDEAYLLEQRHEDLKRQIALKEKQLADMTGERDTVNLLRHKLGLEPGFSAGSLPHDGGPRMDRFKQDNSKRDHGHSLSPVEPVSHSNMTGQKSTPLRGVSDDRTSGIVHNISDRKRQLQAQYEQQLQFNPTKLPRRPAGTTKRTSNSPLRDRSSHSRSKSRSRGRPTDKFEETQKGHIESIRYDRSYMNKAGTVRNYQKNSNSPLRKSPDLVDIASSSSNLIKPQPIRSFENPSSRSYGMQAARHAPAYSFNPSAQMPDRTMPALGGQETREQLYRDRVEAMTLDNQSLQRRLNQVTTELERIQRENEDLRRGLGLSEQEADRLNALLSNKDNVDAQNHILQEDLDRLRLLNKDLDFKLKSEEVETSNTGLRLCDAEAHKKNLVLETDNLNHDIHSRARQYEEINREKLVVIEKLNTVSNELERCNREHLQFNHENIDMDTHIQRLQGEKRDLLANIERLTINMDDCARNLTRERREMDSNNDWHVKLIMSKVIYTQIEQFMKVRKQTVYRNIHEYSDFDRDCHNKLRNFANVLLKIGHYRQKMGLNQWYDKSLRPLKTRHQNEDISIAINCSQLQARVFFAWKQYQQNKMDMYYFKTNAIQKMWHLLNLNARQEQKRAMDIWKQKQGFNRHKLGKMMTLLKKRKQFVLEQAVFRWKSQGQLMEHVCRTRILQLDFSHKLFLSHVFYQMRLVLNFEKRRRQRTLRHFLKGWQDYMIYNRHLMQSNMASIQFGNVNSDYLKRSVFNELRQNAETRKYQLLHQAVEDDMNIAIADTEAFVGEKSHAIKIANQTRAGNIVRDMLGKKLYSFFIHWHNRTRYCDVVMNTKVKDRIIKTYLKLMASYFDGWKKKTNTKVSQKKMRMVQELQMSCETMQTEALVEEKQLRVHAEAVRTSKRKMVDKTFRKLFYRQLSVAIGRWKDICNMRTGQETKAELVIKRMRNRYLRQAFDLYLAFYRKDQQHTRNERSADYIIETIRIREMRKLYNAWCQYTNKMLLIKRYWRKILHRMDLYLKQRAVKIWNVNANTKYSFDLETRQNQITNDIRKMNEEIGEFTMNDGEQRNEISSINKTEQKNAYRQIANYFFRSYTRQTGEKFKIWKSTIKSKKHKQALMKRQFEHYRRVNLEYCRRALRKFLSDERRAQHLAQIKELQINSHDLQLAIEHNNKMQDKFREENQAFQGETGAISAELEQKVLHTMECMARRNLNWVYVSRKRMIFEMWRFVLKQEKAVCYAFKNVLEKTFLKEGLTAIQGQHRDNTFTDTIKRSLRRFTGRYTTHNLTDAFGRWKHFAAKSVTNNNDEVTQKLNEHIAEFEAFVDQAKEVNNARVYKFMIENNKANIWKAWLNVIKNFKLTKAKTVEFRERQVKIQRVDALRLWKARVKRTQRCRAKHDNLVRQFQFKYYRASFMGWKRDYKNKKHLSSSLSNFEMLMRTKIVGDSFKDLRSFAVSKGLVISQRKHKGSEDILSLIRQAYLKRLGTEFQKYKNQCGMFDEKTKKLRTVYGKVSSHRMRDAFDWWRKKDSLQYLARDLYETGPVRAQHWQAEREIANLKEFMRDQHYTEGEIDKFYGDVCAHNDHVMNKIMKRWHFLRDPDRRVLPIVMNRWKEFVAMRKLLKYHFQQSHNATQEGKADLQRAFKKWRNGPDQLAEDLWKLPIDTIVNLAMKTTKELGEAGDMVAENQSITNHLVLQRDEFLNYYIKGQVLAMALVRDRVKFTEYQGVSRWLWAKRIMERIDKEREIRDAAYLHANLKDKEKRLKEENKQLESENAELGVFTKDGEIIMGNRDRLQAERDKLAGQIAETDDDYQELMDRNAQLLKEVEAAEALAKESKGKAFQNLAGFKSFEPAKEPDVPQETEEEKAQRLRFEKLAKLSQGASLR